jgi:hypothetical protein
MSAVPCQIESQSTPRPPESPRRRRSGLAREVFSTIVKTNASAQPLPRPECIAQIAIDNIERFLFQLLAIEEILVIRVKRNFSGAFHRPVVARMKDARLGPERELDETIYNILC